MSKIWNAVQTIQSQKINKKLYREHGENGPEACYPNWSKNRKQNKQVEADLPKERKWRAQSLQADIISSKGHIRSQVHDYAGKMIRSTAHNLNYKFNIERRFNFNRLPVRNISLNLLLPCFLISCKISMYRFQCTNILGTTKWRYPQNT